MEIKATVEKLQNGLMHYIDYIVSKENMNINKNDAKKYCTILSEYIFVNLDFVNTHKEKSFYRYIYKLILDKIVNTKCEEEHSNEFNDKYENVKKRIDLPIKELKYKEIVDFDYENEILVIAFRILKFFCLKGAKDEKLYLNFESKKYENVSDFIPDVRVYNDYKSNVFICVINEENIDYATLKCVENRINDLRQEIEYLNDFVLNYYQQDFFNIFKITKVVFDKKKIEDRFVQGEVKFKASFNIIYKLIGPLYLNKESYGIRELIQNAVDACNKKQNTNKRIDIKYFEDKKTGEHLIRIKDNGVGMDEKTILDKFLTIGESVKENDKSIGKFGIGVLATFLLADKMKFKTFNEQSDYIFESEFIELEAVKDKGKFINIKKVKNDKKFEGTEIVLSLKESIYRNSKIEKLQSDLHDETIELINNLFGRDRHYGKVWYGYSDEIEELRKKVPMLLNFKQELKTIGEIKDNADWIKELVKDIDEFIDSYNTPDAQLKNNIKIMCDKVKCNLNKISHMKAYCIFEILASNKWYLLEDESLKISFFDDEEEMFFMRNFSSADIIMKESKETVLEKIMPDINVKYLWSDNYAGNVFCNNMLIPNKYNFNSMLAKVFKDMPTILIQEGKDNKIEVDLARENCKLVVKGKDYEKDILNKILSDCLQTKQCNNFLNTIKCLYFLDDSGNIKKIRKNAAWLCRQEEKRYCLVFIKDNDKENEQNERDIIEKLSEYYTRDTIFEFVNDTLRMDRVFNEVEKSDLYVAASYGGIVYLNQSNFNSITQFNTKHMKALVLAAKNIYGNVCVGIKNQLLLNTTELQEYKEYEKYKKRVEQKGENIYCLNYNYNGEEPLDINLTNITAQNELSNVTAIVQVNVKIKEYDNDNIFKFFRDIMNVCTYKRQDIWNGFQIGIYEAMENSEFSEEVKKLLMQEE